MYGNGNTVYFLRVYVEKTYVGVFESLKPTIIQNQLILSIFQQDITPPYIHGKEKQSYTIPKASLPAFLVPEAMCK